MSKLLKLRVKKAGLPPGSLMHTGEIRPEKLHLSVIDYDLENVAEIPNATIKECLTYLDKPSMTWINVRGISDPATLEIIGKHFGLHPLIMEDILSNGQRPKLDDYKSTVFIVMRALHFDEKTGGTDDEQVSFVLGPNFLLSFIESEKDIFDPVRARIRNPNSRLRQSCTDYLCYALVDCIVDNYFVILEKLDGKLEKLDEELAHSTESTVLFSIQRLKREIIILRKSIWPVRELINQFRRMETPLIHENTKLFMHDVYDHTVQAIDTIESFRDIVGSMQEVYLSNISMRMNEIMKVLTVVSTIFVPLTFITSVYGMNFVHIPELQYRYGYFLVWGAMVITTVIMLSFFRRKKWI